MKNYGFGKQKPNKLFAGSKSRLSRENGFSLVEAMIALIIMAISVVGVFSVFTYATIFNSGNSNRSQALSVLQKKAEEIRSAKFVPAKTDPDLQSGEHIYNNVVSGDEKTKFQVKITVDDDPFTTGIQSIADSTLKEVTIEVIPQASVFKWQTAVPASLVMRRVRAN